MKIFVTILALLAISTGLYVQAAFTPRSTLGPDLCDRSLVFPPRGTYTVCFYDTRTLHGFTGTDRDIAVLDYDWQYAPPNPFTDHDNFEFRGAGLFTFDGTYIFTVTADDGFRVLIDDVVVFDKWFDQPPTTYHFTKTLNGEHKVTVRYYERGGQAVAKLDWELVAAPCN